MELRAVSMRTGVEPLTFSLEDVCFVHWPVDQAVVDDLLPDWLAPDTADETAWVSALPFDVAELDLFGLPVREDVHALNLRTYVRSPNGDRGVYFLSLDVTDRLAVDTARRLFRLPYHRADVQRSADDGETTGNARTTIRVRRDARRASTFAVTYEPSGPTQEASPDTLASFLTERYRYFTEGPFGTRLVGSVGHEPWSLQSATAHVTETGLLDTVGVPAPDEEPLSHYSAGTRMRFGPPKPLSRAD